MGHVKGLASWSIGVSMDRGWAKESHVPAVLELAGVELAAVATNSHLTADVVAHAFGAAIPSCPASSSYAKEYDKNDPKRETNKNCKALSVFCKGQRRMTNDCVLCSFQNVCAENTIVLFAPTPILHQIVKSHLDKMEIPFRVMGELFQVKSDPRAVIAGLRSRLSAPERNDLRVSRERGAALLAASSLEEYGRRLDTEWFDIALKEQKFTTYFQPIVDTRTFSPFAHECLIRLFADRSYNGDEIVKAALMARQIHLFDSYARRLSVAKAGEQFIAGTKVFINFMPSSIYDPAFCMASTLEAMAKTSLQPEDIVFEVVESDEIHDVKHLEKICNYYRKQGFGFALDDVGTGSSSLQMVCDLKPDYIKLDKSLTSKLADPMHRSVIERLAEFARQFGLQVIAEGVETASTLATLQQIGIVLMQGYYFGRPAPKMIDRLDADCGHPAQQYPTTPEVALALTHLPLDVIKPFRTGSDTTAGECLSS